MLNFPNSHLPDCVNNSNPIDSNLIGYKVENNLLKLYYKDDGFFYFDTNCVMLSMYRYIVDGQFVNITDSNWYNCAVFEEVK